MLLEKNFTSRMMYILLFLFSLNIFNQSSLILAAIFILVVIYDRGKLHIPANDNVFFVLVIFAAAFFSVFRAEWFKCRNIRNWMPYGLLYRASSAE